MTIPPPCQGQTHSILPPSGSKPTLWGDDEFEENPAIAQWWERKRDGDLVPSRYMPLDRILHGENVVTMSEDRLSAKHTGEREDIMKDRRKFGFIIVLVSMLVLSQTAIADQSAEEAALATSQAWLALVDQGDYVKSWEEAAACFRMAATLEQWQRSMIAFRDPLGKMVSRKLKSKHYTKTLPGAPDGEYVVIQYETSFENKKSAIETITPMLDKDGRWRVSGYYIR
jgi:hypothetical protein